MLDTGDIYINGKQYRVNLQTYQGKDIIDFAPRASVPNGSVFMSDLSLYQPLVQSDWRHGNGFHWYTDAAGYMSTTGRIDTRQNGLVMLYTQSIATDTDDSQKDGMTTFDGYEWFWGISGLRRFDGISWTEPYSNDTLFALAAGDYLFYCPNNARIRKVAITTGTHSDAGLDANSTDYKWLIIHNGYIYAGKDNTNRIHYSSQPDLSDLEGTTSDPGVIYCGLGNLKTLGAVVYAGQLYVSRADGLWNIGEDNIARRVLDYSDVASVTNFQGMTVINGLLVYSIRDRVVQWNGARVADITPERITDVFPYVTYGSFKHFVAVDNFLYCIARTNQSTYEEHLLCWDGVGWHKMADLVTNGQDSITFLKYDALNHRLWYHYKNVTGTDVTYYIGLQQNSSFPLTNFPTTGTHSLITSRMEMGFRQVQKSVQSVWVEAHNVTAARYISVYYSLDGGSWILWDNITENGITELTNPGGYRTVEFHYMQLRFDFVTDNTAQSPVLESYTLRFIMRPDVRWGYSFDIIASSYTETENMQDERTAAQIKDELREIRDSKAPVSFKGLAGEELYGYLTSVKEQPAYRTLASTDGTSYIEFALSCSFVEMI